jgi:ligand-binding sensor domain-containing protein
VNGAGPQTRVPSLAWLRLAQLAFYENRDTERSAFYSRRVDADELSPAQREELERLRRRLSFRELGPGILGLGDGNVSALRADGDDLWIGTWNGGICRLSLSGGQPRVFREGRDSLVPSTVRCIEITPSRVWVGTYQGLFAYSKAGGTWQEIGAFGGAEPCKIEALRLAAGRLYVGTLGQGLWRQEGEGWRRISSGPLPGDFVTCLERDGEELLIGTLSLGVVRLNLGSLALRGFAGELEAGNITVLLADPPKGFWIGTYGKGLYHWDRQASRLAHFSRAAGQLGDDWVLCAVRAESGTYFGTLGGGLARHSRGAWQVLGFREGIPAADVPALTYSPPFLYLGSLGAGVTELREGPP